MHPFSSIWLVVKVVLYLLLAFIIARGKNPHQEQGYNLQWDSGTNSLETTIPHCPEDELDLPMVPTLSLQDLPGAATKGQG